MSPARPRRGGGRPAASAGARRPADQLDLGADVASFPALVDVLYRTRWHVYAKAPFGGPLRVFRYLGAYTHRVGLANSRLLDGLAASANVQTKHAAAMLCLGALPELELKRGDDGECGADKSEPSELPEGQFPAAVFVALLAAGHVPCPRCTKGLLRVRGGGGPDPP